MKKNEILFNKYHIKNNELSNFYKSIQNKKISANNIYQKKCQKLISKFFKFNDNFITHSCTSALEALVTKLKDGIMTSSPFLISMINAAASNAEVHE